MQQPTLSLVCPSCGSSRVYNSGTRQTAQGVTLQRHLCKDCNRRFSDANPYKLSKTNTTDRTGAISGVAKSLVFKPQRNKVVEYNAQNPTQQQEQGSIIDFYWYVKKQGYSDATAETRFKIIKLLHKRGVNIADPEAVKLAIAKMDSWSNGHKLVAVHAYDNYVKMLGIKWEPPTYNPVKSLPFVPQEKEIDTLISGCSKKIATSLLLLKETGCRVGEAWMLRWTDLDEENSTINIRAEKGGNPRQLKISARLISMLLRLPKTNDYIFGNTSLSAHRWRFDQQKRALSVKLQNPRLLKIKFHSLRHWKASREYATTKSLLHVKEMLGHRNIVSTMTYAHLIPFDDESEQYFHATAKTDQEAGDLIDQGFTYVCTTPSGTMMFKKKKAKA